MAIDPYTDPDSIRALYTNPDDEMILVEYLTDAAAIQLGLVPASGRGVTNIATNQGTGEEIVSSGGDVSGGFEDIEDPLDRPPSRGDLDDPLLT